MMYAFTAMTLLGISHFLFFWVMTEHKYSRSKTALIYSGFVVLFVCLTMLIYTMFGNSIGYFSIAFTSTIVVAFLIFLFTSADPICKKVFLFISYANAFCIFVCISLMLCRVLFKGAPNIFVYYARNITRTVLFLPMAYVYVRFFRPSVRAVSGQRRKTWYSISTVSFLFLVIFALFVMIFYGKYERIGDYAPFFAVSVLIYASILWVIFGTIKSMIDESNTELINQNISYLQGQLKTAKENELSAKTVRHDFRHHNQNIEAMLKKGEIDEALRYLQQYNDSLDEIKPNDFCPNIEQFLHKRTKERSFDFH